LTVENLVSTIIPVFNRPALVQEAVDSVLAQTHQIIEIIIIDDGSTDDTPVVLDRIANAYPLTVRIIRQKNQGPGASREAGRREARGEFVQYLDSDDVILPRKFELQIQALKIMPEAPLCYGITEYHRLGANQKTSIFADTDKPVEAIFPSFLKRRRWGTSSPLYRRKLVDNVGAWGDMWAEEDWEYDCRIGALNLPIAYVDECVSVQRGIPGQRLSQKGRDDKRTLASQAQARLRIYENAKRAGVQSDVPEMEAFFRGVFMLARDCGGTGLYDVAGKLLDTVECEAGELRLRRRCRIYRVLAETLGWEAVSRVSRQIERIGTQV